MKQQLSWLLLAALVSSCGSKETEIHPEKKMLTSAVYASGSLVPEEEYKVISSVDGYLVQALVKEGDTVHKGQLMFAISNDVRNAQVQGAEALVKRTMPGVVDNAPVFRELQGKLDVARIRMQQDSLQYQRYKNLFEQNAISKSNYEKYYLQYQSSLKDYQSLKQNVEQQHISANLQLQQAENSLMVAAAQSEVGKLKSFVNGVVYDVYKKEGDLINPNQAIALVGAGKMYAKLMVDEDDLDKVYAGQQVLITMDAFPEKVFKAHISKVYPLLSKVEQSFRVDAQLDDAVPVSMYGLNLEANIVVADKKSVLAIPRAAVMKGDTVWVKENGDKKKVKIQKGIEDDTWVEVRGGITESSVVILEK
ncbi:MAG: HlyD family efflux transporter periplasmic adaptor subunit [Chitinophagales bacterium]|nr:HlyD family efflux transporter periplasmic adaptor subunit [Chitinophagales bacterium]